MKVRVLELGNVLLAFKIARLDWVGIQSKCIMGLLDPVSFVIK